MGFVRTTSIHVYAVAMSSSIGEIGLKMKFYPKVVEKNIDFILDFLSDECIRVVLMDTLPGVKDLKKEYKQKIIDSINEVLDSLNPTDLNYNFTLLSVNKACIPFYFAY